MPTANPTSTPLATEPVATDTPAPSATAEASPTVAPASSPPSTPTPVPTLEPTARRPTEAPTPDPTPIVTPSPVITPAPTPDPTPSRPQRLRRRSRSSTLAPRRTGRRRPIAGVLTTQLGALEAGRKAFIQDDTAGIALYLDAIVTDGLPAGTAISVSGVVDDRFAERTLRVNVADIVVLGQAALPSAALAPTGSIGESLEGGRVTVQGVTVGSPSSLADGLGLMVDDGSGRSG